MTSDQMAGRPVHDKIISLKIVLFFLCSLYTEGHVYPFTLSLLLKDE